MQVQQDPPHSRTWIDVVISRYIKYTIVEQAIPTSDPKVRYELNNAASRFMLTIVGLTAYKYPGRSIWMSLINNDQIAQSATRKLIQELIDIKNKTRLWTKKPPKISNAIIEQRVLKGMADNACDAADPRFPRRYSMLLHSGPRFTTTYDIYFERLKFHIPEHLRKYDKYAVFNLYLRYNALDIETSSQFWSLPHAVFDILYECGVRMEGFANPIERNFATRPQTGYCSIFDEDKQFGSYGSFFDVCSQKGDMGQKWVLNPPFIEAYIEQVCNIWNKGMSGALFLPDWADMECIKALKRAHAGSMIALAPRTFYLENMPTPANFACVMFLRNIDSSAIDRLKRAFHQK